MTDKKNKGGRPAIVLTDKQKQEVETLAPFLSTEMIADYIGIGRSTFFNILERDEEVSGLYKKGRAKAVGSVAQSLVQKALAGDTASAIFFLKTQAGWKETQKIEGAGDDGVILVGYKWLDDEDEND